MKENFARALVIVLVGAALALPFLGRWLDEPNPASAKTVELHGRMPENGGWSLETIKVEAGQPLHLRLTSDDVMHSFALGQNEFTPVDITPGEWVETTLIFDQPGQYTYYCTRWCGANHWRMRGVIEVGESAAGANKTEERPLFLEMNLDLDAPHPAENLPAEKPAASRGALFLEDLPEVANNTRELQANSPSEMWSRLRSDPALEEITDQQIWDMIAFAYSRLPGSQDLQAAGELYRQNCQACHGEQGKGDGVMVRGLPPMVDHAGMGREATRPPDFSDPTVLLGASPALLEGKIIRGGMGTGMPNWGSIFTTEQIHSLAVYLYQFQMSLEVDP